MRTIEYIAVSAIVLLGAWWLATPVSASISSSFEHSAEIIRKAGN